jgi:hypothetical protein
VPESTITKEDEMRPIFYGIPNEHGDILITVCLKYHYGFTTRGLAICSPYEDKPDRYLGMKLAEERADWAYGTAVKEIVETFGLGLSLIGKSQLRKFGDHRGNEITRDEAKLIMLECNCSFDKKAYSAPKLTEQELYIIDMEWGHFGDH